MTTQGLEVSQAIEYTVNAAIFANFAVSGIALTASGYNIFEKVCLLQLFQNISELLGSKWRASNPVGTLPILHQFTILHKRSS